MLNQIRAKAGNFAAKILLALLILSFAIWGIGDMVNPGRNVDMATIGSATISRDEFLKELRREMENVQRTLGSNYSPDLIKRLHLPEQVLRSMVSRTLIGLESESLSLVPSDEDIARRIRANSAFRGSEGKFSKETFQAILRQRGLTEKAYVEELRQQLATGLLMDTLGGNTPIPPTATRTLYQSLAEQRTATLYKLKPSLVAVLSPTEEQIEGYYRDHASEFSVPEYRSVSYISFDSASAQKPAAVSESELRAAYQERLATFKRPERRTVGQLLYDSEDSAKAAAALLQSGKSFDQAAKETGKRAMPLGTVERERVPQEAADAVFALKAGEYTAPIKTPFGWHIFRVVKIEPPAMMSFEEAKPALEKELTHDTADDGLNQLANQLEDALAGGSSLEEAAKEMGLKVRITGLFDHQGKTQSGSTAKDLPELDKFIETAFKTDEKTESGLITSKGGVYYILHTDRIAPEHVRPLNEVRAQAESGWKKQQQETRLAELAKETSGKFVNPQSRNQVISHYKLEAVASGPLKHGSTENAGQKLPPALVADIFARKPGESTGAYAAGSEYLLAVVKDIIPASAPKNGEALMAEISKNLESNMQNELVEQYLRYLESKHPVWINEAALNSMNEE